MTINAGKLYEMFDRECLKNQRRMSEQDAIFKTYEDLSELPAMYDMFHRHECSHVLRKYEYFLTNWFADRVESVLHDAM